MAAVLYPGTYGSGDNFHLVKILNAGRYFVRVEGVGGAEGSYGLTSAFVRP